MRSDFASASLNLLNRSLVRIASKFELEHSPSPILQLLGSTIHRQYASYPYHFNLHDCAPNPPFLAASDTTALYLIFALAVGGLAFGGQLSGGSCRFAAPVALSSFRRQIVRCHWCQATRSDSRNDIQSRYERRNQAEIGGSWNMTVSAVCSAAGTRSAA